jgi:hypothetical protein
MEIDKRCFHEFMSLWNAGAFKQQRFGQAFYNHFSLHLVKDPKRFGNLYEAGEEEAKRLVHSHFQFI